MKTRNFLLLLGSSLLAALCLLAPLGAQCWSQPITPEKVLRALGKVR